MIRLHIVTPPLKWTARKCQMMIQELHMLMTREGVPNCQFHVEDVGGSDSRPVHNVEIALACSACPGETWKAPKFSPCPKCGGRMTVRKLTAEEAKALAPPEPPKPSPAPPPEEPPFKRRRGRPPKSKSLTKDDLTPYVPESRV